METGHVELILKNGGRKEFWLTHVAHVAKFVEMHGKELTKLQEATAARAAPLAEAHAARALIWDPTRGGMRMPHLHHAGEIYLLNEAQWAEFSKTAVASLTERLNRAGKVTFETVMGLADAAAGH